MSLAIIKPITITDDILTASNVAAEGFPSVSATTAKKK